MASEWITEKIGKIAMTNINTYSPKEEWEFVNYLDTGNITEGKISSIKRFNDMNSLPSRARRKVQAGDIVYSTVRPNQKHYGIITEPAENMLVSTGFAVIRGITEKCISKYLYYFLTQKRIVNHLHALAEQSTSAYPSIRPSDIGSLTIHLPPLSEQNIIAHILGTLDDKIELNRKMNETLGAMAQTLFKSWFVDFDPVIDKALAAGNPIPEELSEKAERRKQLGDKRKPLPEDIVSLFPDEFENSELGWIPKGWEIDGIDNIASLKTKSVKPIDSPEAIWTHFSIPAFDEERLPKQEKGKLIKSNKFMVPPTSVLVSKLNPQFPRVWLPDVLDTSYSICSTEFMPFVSLGRTERPYLYTFFKSEAVQSQIQQRVTGSTGSRQRVKPKDIAVMKVLIPTSEVRRVYSEYMEVIFKKISKNKSVSNNLSITRDTLLPKLISGNLKVPDVEK